jgi:hypothetical protein
MMTLDAPHLTLLFVATIAALATAFVWMFCEVERRFGGRLNEMVLARISRLGARGARRNENRRD